MKDYAVAAGVQASPNQLRHATGTGMLNRGGQLSIIQDFLGQASPTGDQGRVRPLRPRAPPNTEKPLVFGDTTGAVSSGAGLCSII